MPASLNFIASFRWFRHRSHSLISLRHFAFTFLSLPFRRNFDIAGNIMRNFDIAGRSAVNFWRLAGVVWRNFDITR